MSRSSWKFATAVPVRRSGSDEDSRLLGRGRGGRAGGVAFGRDRELGEVAVADDLAELPFGLEHAGGGPAERLFEAAADPEPLQRECLLEALAQGGGGAGMRALELGRQRPQPLERD